MNLTDDMEALERAITSGDFQGGLIYAEKLVLVAKDQGSSESEMDYLKNALQEILRRTQAMIIGFRNAEVRLQDLTQCFVDLRVYACGGGVLRERSTIEEYRRY